MPTSVWRATHNVLTLRERTDYNAPCETYISCYDNPSSGDEGGDARALAAMRGNPRG
jgi:hypothetical protein